MRTPVSKLIIPFGLVVLIVYLALVGGAGAAVARIGVRASTAPSIAITSPANGTAITGTATFTVAVSGTTQQVDFLLDGKPWAHRSSPPYTFTMNTNNVRAGTHQITAGAVLAGVYQSTSIQVDVVRQSLAPPANLTVGSVTQTSLTLGWTPPAGSVAGYDVYENSAPVATSATPGQTVGGLACGTSYTLAVDAYDAAGNHSAQAQTTAQTAACAQQSSGGSTATCTPSPCQPGKMTYHSITVDDGAGKLTTRPYWVYRPANLTNSPTNRAPLLVRFESLDPSWDTFADTNRFVIVELPPAIPTGYYNPIINPNYANIAVVNTCGPSGTAPCDQGPFVKAVLASLVPQENVDPAKVFATGSSKGGYATEETMCDPLTSSSFRGFVVVSAYLASQGAGPSVPPRCPALATNRNLSVQYEVGTNDPNTSLTGRMNPNGFYEFGQQEGIVSYLNGRLGCGGSATVQMFGTGSLNERDTWAACANQPRATSLAIVAGGAHGYPGLTGVNGFDPRAEAWAFLTGH